MGTYFQLQLVFYGYKRGLKKGKNQQHRFRDGAINFRRIFFYGMINNIQAQKEKEIAQEETKKALACEKYSLLLTEQLQEKERQLTQARAEAAFLMEQTREKRNK